jgi:hypothetical protein
MIFRASFLLGDCLRSVMRHTCFYSEPIWKSAFGSDGLPKGLCWQTRLRSEIRFCYSIALRGRRSYSYTGALSVAKPIGSAWKPILGTSKSLTSSDTFKGMADAAPPSQAASEGVKKFKQLFAGAMPKEEIAALSFLKVRLFRGALWWLPTTSTVRN